MMDYLARAASPVIVLAPNLGEAEYQLQQYGLLPTSPGVYVVYSLDEAYTISLGLDSETPWCKVCDYVDSAAVMFMRSVYGAERPMGQALNVQNVGVAINPKVLT